MEHTASHILIDPIDEFLGDAECDSPGDRIPPPGAKSAAATNPLLFPSIKFAKTLDYFFSAMATA